MACPNLRFDSHFSWGSPRSPLPSPYDSILWTPNFYIFYTYVWSNIPHLSRLKSNNLFCGTFLMPIISSSLSSFSTFKPYPVLQTFWSQSPIKKKETEHTSPVYVYINGCLQIICLCRTNAYIINKTQIEIINKTFVYKFYVCAILTYTL